ncbi:unnamed protein product [Diplocarpon coronariae]
MATSPHKYPTIKLPHPYLTTYHVLTTTNTDTNTTTKTYPTHIHSLSLVSHPDSAPSLPEPFHDPSLTWSPLTSPSSASSPPSTDNSLWARAARSPGTTFQWPSSSSSSTFNSRPSSPSLSPSSAPSSAAATATTPSLAAIWNVIHAIYLAHPSLEYFRLSLEGEGREVVERELLATGLAIGHPKPWHLSGKEDEEEADEVLVTRSAFWQGAGSPVGARGIWVADASTHQGEKKPTFTRYPLYPSLTTLTMKFPHEAVYARHPTRRPKPAPGSIVYSRFIPELSEHFSLEAVDFTSAAHLALFHKWQNDPRVAAGWNETGTLDEHRAYLRRLAGDPHVLTLFGRFEDTRFAYFEIYWAAEDHYGAHYASHAYDRGRHSLVGDASFRGAQRVNAWYSSCIHFCFLDDARTLHAVGEPKATGGTILSYENAQGLTIGQYVDLGHKRSVHSVVSREKWFQLCPLWWDGRGKPLESSDRAAWNARL